MGNPTLHAHIVLFALASMHAVCAACPEQLPAGLRGESVGEKMVVNGLPMNVLQVTSRESAAEVLDRVEREWKDQRYVVKRSKVNEWGVVSALDASCNTTLQLFDRQGAFGYFGVAQPNKAQAWLPKTMSIKLPGSIEVNSSVSSEDGGRRALTMAFSTRRTVADINDYFLAQFDRDGWQSVKSHEIRTTTDHRATVITAQKGRERIELVLRTDGTTRATLNVSESL